MESEAATVLESMNKIDIPKSIDDMTDPQLRRCLFRYYDEIEEYDNYKEINEKTRNYHSAMMRNSLPEDLERINVLFVNNDVFTLET